MEVKNIWSGEKDGFFRKQFNLSKTPQRAYIRVFSDTGYELFLNGRIAATVEEWGNTRDYQVAAFLKEGINTIALHGVHVSGHRGFCLEAVVDGETVTVTNETWKASKSEKWGWMLEQYDDSDWQSALVKDMRAAGFPQWWTRPGSDPDLVIPTLDNSQFFCREIPKASKSPYWTAKKCQFQADPDVVQLLGEDYREYAAADDLLPIQNYMKIMNCSACQEDGKIRILQTERYTGPGFIADFGKEMVGYFRMKVSSAKRVSFRLHYGETLDQAMGEPPRSNTQNRMLREEYSVSGGVQEWESRMRVAFRFVRVEFFDCEARVEAEGFTVRTALYPVMRKGFFACSDDTMNWLWQAGARTLHYCMQEYYLDAPMRDRFLWTGDTRLEALINYYTYGDMRLFEFCWDELSRCQYPDGGIPASYGVGMSMLWDYVAWYLIAFHDYYMYTGNGDFLRKHAQHIYKATDYLTGLTDEEGIISVPENPLGKEWMVELNEFVGKDPYLNELYLRALKTASLTAELSDNLALKQMYDDRISLTEKNVAKLLADDSMTKLFDHTGHTQIQYELAEMDLKNGNFDRMIERIRKCWGAMQASGADCLRECALTTSHIPRIDEHHAGEPDFLSNCHGWTAAATVLLPMGIAGVKPVEPGFSRVEIAPNLFSFQSFRCAVPTPAGEIAVRYEDNRLQWIVPEGLKVKVIVEGQLISESNRGDWISK